MDVTEVGFGGVVSGRGSGFWVYFLVEGGVNRVFCLIVCGG